jgi:hypothetical protein
MRCKSAKVRNSGPFSGLQIKIFEHWALPGPASLPLRITWPRYPLQVPRKAGAFRFYR